MWGNPDQPIHGTEWCNPPMWLVHVSHWSTTKPTNYYNGNEKPGRDQWIRDDSVRARSFSKCKCFHQNFNNDCILLNNNSLLGSLWRIFLLHSTTTSLKLHNKIDILIQLKALRSITVKRNIDLVNWKIIILDCFLFVFFFAFWRA